MFPISPTLIPLNPEYGSKVPARTQPANPFRLNYNTISHETWDPLKQLLIDIYGIPTHLCSDTTVRALLQDACNVKQISFSTTDHVYTVTAETHSLHMIPSVAHLGVKKFERGQPFLHIWPLWLDPTNFTSEDDFHMKILQDQ